MPRSISGGWHGRWFPPSSLPRVTASRTTAPLRCFKFMISEKCSSLFMSRYPLLLLLRIVHFKVILPWPTCTQCFRSRYKHWYKTLKHTKHIKTYYTLVQPSIAEHHLLCGQISKTLPVVVSQDHEGCSFSNEFQGIRRRRSDFCSFRRRWLRPEEAGGFQGQLLRHLPGLDSVLCL